MDPVHARYYVVHGASENSTGRAIRRVVSGSGWWVVGICVEFCEDEVVGMMQEWADGAMCVVVRYWVGILLENGAYY